MAIEESRGSRQRDLTGFWQWVIIIISIITIFIVINHIFHLDLLGGSLAMQSSFLYMMLGLYASTVFLFYPVRSEEKYKRNPYFSVDIILFLATLGISFIFAFKGLKIVFEGWMIAAPMPYSILAIIIILLVLEAARRSQGLVISLIIAGFSLYPLLAESLPGFLGGIQFDIIHTVNYHAFSLESLIGLPMAVTGNLVIGFMIFGTALVATGGGAFFMNFALSLLGKTRGGAAKVSVLSSAFFGSISGSSLSNIVTTGTVTIPAMQKTGYPTHFAAATEACASTGGVLMPPIMGATAFLMVEFLGMPYLKIAVAAAIPSIMYYTGMIVQIDAHAVIHNLKGLPAEEIPSLIDTLKKGWFYIGALIILMFFLFMRVEAQSPFFCTIFLLVCANFRKETRINLQKIKGFLIDNIQILGSLIALIAGIGMIIGSLVVTGVASALSREIVFMAGDNLLLMVFLGALASFLLGMGVSITACYVLLAITIAPSLVQVGLDPLAVHLFLLYCGMMSYITLPVAIAVYTAASIARTSPFATGMTAMRLGIAKYIVPFFFVLNPALIFRGALSDIILSTTLALVGIFFISSSFGGYLIGVGTLSPGVFRRLEDFVLRPILFIGGVLIGAPERVTDFVGLVVTFSVVIVFYRLNRLKK